MNNPQNEMKQICFTNSNRFAIVSLRIGPKNLWENYSLITERTMDK